jgi:hypothetical protein
MGTPLFCYMWALRARSRKEPFNTKKNNYMVPVRWVHTPSLTIYGLVGPDQERSHFTPNGCYPSFFGYSWILFQVVWTKRPLRRLGVPPSNYNCEKELWVRTNKLKPLDRANQHQPSYIVHDGWCVDRKHFSIVFVSLNLTTMVSFLLTTIQMHLPTF